MAAADAVVVAVSPPMPEPVLGHRPAVVKVFVYLCLASLWVGSAALAAATVARRAWGESSPVFKASLKASIGGILITVLFIVLFYLRLLRAMCATGFGLSTWARTIQHHVRKVLGALTWKMLLRDTTVLGGIACFPFILLLIAGVLVFMGLLPVEGSQRERIGYDLFDVGILGTMAMFCFIILPSFALKVWRSK